MAFADTKIHEHYKRGRSWLTHFLWQQDLPSLPIWERALVRSCQIVFAIFRDLFQGQLSLRAMSLVFTTVIGFFPLLALSFAVLKSFGVHNSLEPTLLTLMEPLGDRREELASQVLGYVDNLQVEVIGIISIGLLLYIVIDMMRKIESSFNFIWAVKRGRSWSNRISEYLFAVIVSPLLLFLSISITAYINTNFFERFLEGLTYGGVIVSVTAFMTSILLMSLAFAFAYGFLPNTKVRFSSAFIGGFVTTLIWKLMGSVFQGFFVSSARESIYLAFATGIAVMFFVYIGWLVALIGSSIAFYHQNPAKARTGRGQPRLSIQQQESLVLAVAAIIIRRFQANELPVDENRLVHMLDSNALAVEEAIAMLEQIGMITRTNDEPPRLLPTHAVENCTLVEIWIALRECNLDSLSGREGSAELDQIEEFQARLDEIVKAQLGSVKFSDNIAEKLKPALKDS